MIFDELVLDVAERLNLTSDEAKSRIGRALNARYRRLTSSIGMETTRRTQVSAVASIGVQTIIFTGIEKVLAVIDKSSGQDVPLTQITPDEMHVIALLGTDPPRNFSVNRTGATSVDILVDCIPTSAFTLYADGYITLNTLAGNQVPAFPESFHDILVYGAMADEYRKMEKMQLYQMCEQDYEKRLSDLRMLIAKSGYLTQFQGKTSNNRQWWERNELGV